MSRALSYLVVLCALLVLGTPGAARASGTGGSGTVTTPAGPLRILLTGDSLTHGRHLDATWRYWLDRELHRQGVAFDLVGSASTPYLDPGYPTSRYLHPFDGDHAARAGATLSQLSGTVGAEVTQHHPDLVVLLAGVNDFLRGASPEEGESRLRGWVAAVRQAAPDTRMVWGEVLTTDRTDDTNARIAAYNVRLRAVAAELTTPASPITVVQTGREWSAAGPLSSDGIHLSPSGETLVAERIAEGLHDAGVLPQRPHLRATLPWTRTERAVVGRVTARRVHVSWGTQAVTATWLRHRTPGSPWVQQRAGSSASFAVRPGRTYEVQLQVTRGRMTGPWGAVTSVRTAARPAAPRSVSVRPRLLTWSAVAGTRTYQVRWKTTPRQQGWTTRTVTGTRLSAARVAVAQVRAVQSPYASAWRTGRR